MMHLRIGVSICRDCYCRGGVTAAELNTKVIVPTRVSHGATEVRKGLDPF